MKLSYMVTTGSTSFLWPSKADMMLTVEENILIEVTIQPVNSGGHLVLSRKDYDKSERSSGCGLYIP